MFLVMQVGKQRGLYSPPNCFRHFVNIHQIFPNPTCSKSYLYFIPVFIYTFVKVKSKKGKERDGCAMAKWFRPFSLLAAKIMCAPGAIKAE